MTNGRHKIVKLENGLSAVELGKPLFLQMDMGEKVFLLLGTPETLSESLGVRLTYTPEFVIRRVSKKFDAKCEFISLEDFKHKVALAQEPDSKYIDVMHFYRPG